MFFSASLAEREKVLKGLGLRGERRKVEEGVYGGNFLRKWLWTLETAMLAKTWLSFSVQCLKTKTFTFFWSLGSVSFFFYN